MLPDPLDQLELEFSFIGLIASLRSLSALMGAAKGFDTSPADLAALIDLAAEKAERTQRLAGF